MGEDQNLGELDGEGDTTIAPSDRKVHTQGYDLSINTLFEQWLEKILILPDFQREYVWDNGKASRLVESLLSGIPIPILYFAETPEATYEIVDGHQRINSLVRYIDNRFGLTGLRLRGDLKGKRFHQLSERDQRFLRTRVMRAIIISADSHPTMKFEIFERLNTGAVALNAQEIRNALFRGPLNQMLVRLENAEDFRTCMGREKPRPRMVDRELVLRFLALRSELSTYRPPLTRFLNNFMDKNKSLDPEQLSDLAGAFEGAAACAARVYGRSAFRRADYDGVALERNVNRALFDAQMLVFSVVDPAELPDRLDDVRQHTAILYDKADFMDAISLATGDRARTHARVRLFGAAVRDAGLSVDLDALGVEE